MNEYSLAKVQLFNIIINLNVYGLLIATHFIVCSRSSIDIGNLMRQKQETINNLTNKVQFD